MLIAAIFQSLASSLQRQWGSAESLLCACTQPLLPLENDDQPPSSLIIVGTRPHQLRRVDHYSYCEEKYEEYDDAHDEEPIYIIWEKLKCKYRHLQEKQTSKSLPRKTSPPCSSSLMMHKQKHHQEVIKPKQKKQSLTSSSATSVARSTRNNNISSVENVYRREIRPTTELRNDDEDEDVETCTTASMDTFSSKTWDEELDGEIPNNTSSIVVDLNEIFERALTPPLSQQQQQQQDLLNVASGSFSFYKSPALAYDETEEDDNSLAADDDDDDDDDNDNNCV